MLISKPSQIELKIPRCLSLALVEDKKYDRIISFDTCLLSYTFYIQSLRPTNMYKVSHTAIFSVFYNISPPNFANLLRCPFSCWE